MERIPDDNCTRRRKVNPLQKLKTQSKTHQPDDCEERKILNTEPNFIVQNQQVDFLTATSAFKTALKQLKCDNKDGSFIKVLFEIQNNVKQKILSLKRQSDSVTLGISKSLAQSTESVFSESSNPELFQSDTKSKSLESEYGDLCGLKLMATSTQSLCSGTSDYSPESKKEFENFLVNVNCPFCLKREDDKNSLIKHINDDCVAIKKKEFIKGPHVPYSVCQILPNNTFKCNVCLNSVHRSAENYFRHLQTSQHTSLFKRAASRKDYTDLLFCSCCKVQIPNNATQIQFHIAHGAHKKNAIFQKKCVPNNNFLLKNGVCCIYNKEKKFKCLVCPKEMSKHETTSKILKHFESSLHLRETKSPRNKSTCKDLIYCMFCSVEVNSFSVIAHFNSEPHLSYEKQEPDEEPFELCYYCGFVCTGLRELALHMELTCIVINEMRGGSGRESKEGEGDSKRIPEKEKYEGEAVNGKNEEQKERPRKGNDESRQSVSDEDFLKVLEPGSSFLKDFVADDSSATRKDISEPDNLYPASNASATGSNQKSKDAEPFSNVSVNDDTVENLLSRAATHLKNTLLKPDCLNIADDCNQKFKLGKFEYVGFLKCGLAFTVENITLYCRLNNDLITEDCSDDDSACLTESELFNTLITQKFIAISKNSDVVSTVRISKDLAIPYVEFRHVKTNNFCTVTFRRSSSILTDMLSNCAQKENIRAFILIIRFWLSVHKLSIKEFEFVVISLIIFFLINSKTANVSSCSTGNFRAYKALEYIRRKRFPFAGMPQFDPGYSKNPRGQDSVKEMFQNFMRFLNAFDFEKNAICLPFEYPVAKGLLLEEPLRKLLSPSTRELDVEFTIWIMDPFLHSNLAVDLKKEHMDSLLKIVRATVKHYNIC